jgi:hypothetical protein
MHPHESCCHQADIPQLEHPSFLGLKQNLHKQRFDFGQKGLAKVGDGIMIGMQSTGNEPKGNALVSSFLNLARTEQTRGIPIEQQPQQDFRRNRFPAEGRILLVDPVQIKLGNDINHKAPQVLGGQRFCQADRLVQGFFVICSLEFSVHARSLPFKCY